MSWRDQLQQASWRGVEFYVDDHTLEFGRRVQLHDYPFKDDAYPEDLGGKDDVYSFPAFVVGEDYMAQRDRLIEALKKEGPGTLVHRYLGQMRVQGGAQRLRETNKEGGIARFSLVFYKAENKTRPSSSINTRQQVTASAGTAMGQVQSQFASSYNLSGLPGWVTGQAGNVLSNLDTSFSKLLSADSLIADYVSVPGTISNMLLSRLDTLNSLSQLRKLFGFGEDLPSVPTTTPSRIQQAKNQQAIVDLVQRASLIEAAEQSSTADYDSHNEAIAVRNELSAALDKQMLTADDETYLVLMDLRAAMVNDLTQRAASLDKIRDYTPQATQPSLVIAHQLYQDANRAEDIVARNQITHPGFVKGGHKLEVLDA